jgi:quercetin dioxygenase-like cupin family protein
MLSHADAMPQHINYFAPGVYVREFPMPAGMLVVGKTHMHAHPMMVLKGRALVFSEFGKQEVEAGHISISQPGAKRVVLALEDTIFATVHANPDDGRDMEVIEARTIRPESPEEIEAAVRGLLR